MSSLSRTSNTPNEIVVVRDLESREIYTFDFRLFSLLRSVFKLMMYKSPAVSIELLPINKLPSFGAILKSTALEFNSVINRIISVFEMSFEENMIS